MFAFQRNRVRFIIDGNFPQCNTVFIDDEIAGIIDPGCDRNKLVKISCKRPVQILVNSHSHIDHFQYNGLFPNADLFAPAIEARAIEDMETFLGQFHWPDRNRQETIDAFAREITESGRYNPRKVNRYLEDGDIICFGETEVHVLHCPGHTPGHLCFHFPKERLLFLADLDLSNSGPYYADVRADIDEVIVSLERLKKIDVDVYLSGHHKKGVFDGDPQLIQCFLEKIYKRDEKILETLKPAPMSLDDISKLGIIYENVNVTTANGSFNFGWGERIMLQKHLTRLERLGKVITEDGFYRLP